MKWWTGPQGQCEAVDAKGGVPPTSWIAEVPGPNAAVATIYPLEPFDLHELHG